MAQSTYCYCVAALVRSAEMCSQKFGLLEQPLLVAATSAGLDQFCIQGAAARICSSLIRLFAWYCTYCCAEGRFNVCVLSGGHGRCSVLGVTRATGLRHLGRGWAWSGRGASEPLKPPKARSDVSKIEACLYKDGQHLGTAVLPLLPGTWCCASLCFISPCCTFFLCTIPSSSGTACLGSSEDAS